jgi:hypothetical protein
MGLVLLFFGSLVLARQTAAEGFDFVRDLQARRFGAGEQVDRKKDKLRAGMKG